MSSSTQYDKMRSLMVRNRDRLKQQTADWVKNPPQDGVYGYPTGLQNIDLKFGGLPREELVVIAGGPGSGKTAFLTQVLENASHTDGGKVHLLVSAEMSQRQLYLRSAARVAGLDSQDVKKGRLTPTEHARFNRALDALIDLPLLVVDTPGITSEDVVTMVGMLREEGLTVGIVGVDYVQLLSDEGQNSNLRLTAVMQRFIQLKNDSECTIALLSQYSRRKEWEGRNARGDMVDRPPQLSDLRDSGSIEQGAEQVWMFHDPIPPENEVHGVPFDASVKRLYVRKNRNGPTGKVDLWYLPTYTLFTDADDYTVEARLSKVQSV